MSEPDPAPTGDPGASAEDGETARRRVLGDEHVDRAQAATTPLTAPFQEHITRCAWGAVWTRSELSQRDRSLITLAVLTALRCPEEVEMHVRAAVRGGVSAEEVAEALLHATVYAGTPAGNTAFAAAQRALSELGHDAARPAASGNSADGR